MNVKYFVVSLPRTGTTSLSKMARICGLNPKHAPHYYWDRHLENNIFDFFSDTPVFSPSTIQKIIDNTNFESKFIFIEKDFTEIFESWVKMGLFYNYKGFYGETTNFDFVSYNDAFGNQELTEQNYEEIFSNHKKIVIDLIQKNNKPLLMYNFNMGWDPFCEFLQVQVPNEPIPTLNKNTFFDEY